MTIEDGLDFIERHLTFPIYPRRIATYTTVGKQIVVNNREEAVARFKQSNLIDCRISAYPYPVPEYKGINRQPPDFFLSDLDQKNFKTKKSFQESMQHTLDNFKDKLHGANPTVLWSGGGLHFLQPLDADIVLEEENVFMEFTEPSRRLMHYAEKLVTGNKADSCHSNTVSFGNCMVRIPGSHNSKYVQFDEEGRIVNIPPNSEVRIIQRWDGDRPNIRWLLKGYWIYLIQQRNTEALNRLHVERRMLRFESKYKNLTTNPQDITEIDWIESLYMKPLDDFRKYCTWRIFIPYFINVKKLSRSQVFNLVINWLNRCNSECKRLDFNPTHKVNDALNSVRKYCPVSKDRLKIENEPFYILLKKEVII